MIDGPTHMAVSETVRLPPGVHCAVGDGGEVFLVARPRSESLGRLTAEQLATLRRLATACTVDDLLDDGFTMPLLQQLRSGGWLTTTVWGNDNQPLYTVWPRRRRNSAGQDPVPDRVALSRFAVLRRDGADMLVESAAATCDVRIHDSRVLAFVGGSLTSMSRTDAPGQLSAEVGRRLVVDLWRAGFLTHQPDAETDELRLAQWSTHELLFHHQSSKIDGTGGTYWAKGRFAPLPGRHRPFDGPAVPLPKPDLARLRADDSTLTTVIEDRRSVREGDEDNPLTLDQLGEFLFRCARVRGVGEYGGQEISDRPYPAGGGLHELEIYPVVRSVAGLHAGLYHYDAHAHRLVRGSAQPAPLRALLKWAGLPQVLFVVSARFGRLMWKYEGTGYALMLKHVGVLYQNMYLVATAMALAPCAIAVGGAEFFAEATGLDPMTESSVGAFTLGSRRPQRSTGADREGKS
ncbi:SagB/ThcOx family dehydrogenase [Kutzneria sp. CA-103260]|uniref:SagB/ThcOx family dehydrogenase n=1 Tax=Kutzneria sp. CA-103260 TaxID=2802641 RepID=UPI001BAAFDB3|nr:SagB family peptide dehydrogenase [Kutzneria sp. CA-103260]QUQ68705.1 Nitroreductase family protein [Kutzneria sp. CA-103260]